MANIVITTSGGGFMTTASIDAVTPTSTNDLILLLTGLM